MDIVKLGIERLVDKSKFLLENIGEFAPFGIIYKNEKWINIETYDERLDSIKIRGFLMNTIIKDFQEDNCLFGAVCVNAEMKDIGNVIIIYNTSDGKDWYEKVYQYTLQNGVINLIAEIH